MTVKLIYTLIIALLLPTLTLAALAKNKNPPTTVDNVELVSYLGVWHEQMRIPNSFQDNDEGHGVCNNSQAEYALLDSKKIQVTNTCYRNNGADIAHARAKAVKGSNNSKLKVNFTGSRFLEWLGIGNGDYWILALGQKNSDGLYSWVLIGAPKRNFGWILSREKILNDNDVQMALTQAANQGYDVNLFKKYIRQ